MIYATAWRCIDVILTSYTCWTDLPFVTLTKSTSSDQFENYLNSTAAVFISRRIPNTKYWCVVHIQFKRPYDVKPTLHQYGFNTLQWEAGYWKKITTCANNYRLILTLVTNCKITKTGLTSLSSYSP